MKTNGSIIGAWRLFGRKNGFVWKSENGAKLKNNRMPNKLCTNAQFIGHSVMVLTTYFGFPFNKSITIYFK